MAGKKKVANFESKRLLIYEGKHGVFSDYIR